MENPYPEFLVDEVKVPDIRHQCWQEGVRKVVEWLDKKDRYLEKDVFLLLPDAEYIKVTMRELIKLKEWGLW